LEEGSCIRLTLSQSAVQLYPVNAVLNQLVLVWLRFSHVIADVLSFFNTSFRENTINAQMYMVRVNGAKNQMTVVILC